MAVIFSIISEFEIISPWFEKESSMFLLNSNMIWDSEDFDINIFLKWLASPVKKSFSLNPFSHISLNSVNTGIKSPLIIFSEILRNDSLSNILSKLEVFSVVIFLLV